MSIADIDTSRLYTDLDIPVDPNASIRVTTTGDVGTITGHSNLLRAVARRLVTVPGSLVYRPDYGCGALTYIGGANSPSQRGRLAASIRAGLLRDPRLSDVAVTVEAGQPGNSNVLSSMTVTLALTLRDGTSTTSTFTLSR